MLIHLALWSARMLQKSTYRAAYTVIELSVVIAVLLVLASIALPNFLVAKRVANDTVARSAVADAYASAKTFWNAERTYLIGENGDLNDSEQRIIDRLGRDHPGLQFDTDLASTSTDPRQVHVDLTDGGAAITLCARSRSTVAFCLQAVEPGRGVPGAPLISIASGPEDGSLPSGQVAFQVFNEVDTITCQLDGGPATPCQSPYSYSNLAVGPHTLIITAIGPNGTETKTLNWTTAPAVPDLQITSTPRDDSYNQNATIAWTNAGGAAASTTCRINGGAWTACANNWTRTGLALGQHTIDVRATNVSGTDTVSYTWDRLNYEQTILADGPAHFYRMEQASGNISWDSISNPTGSGIVWTNPGGAVIGASDGGALSGGDLGSARHLFGSSEAQIGGSSPTNFANSSFSIEVWLRTNADDGCVFGRGPLANNQLVHLCFYRSGPVARMQFGFYADDLYTNYIFPDSTWAQVTVTYDHTTDTSRIYRNGQMVAQGNAGPMINGASNFTIGNHGVGNGFWRGVIDEVSIYSRALTAAEVADHAYTRP